jgi:sugar phosphate isomerase/epimerase
MKRRNFIKTGSLAGTSLLSASWQAMADDRPFDVPAAAGFQLLVLATNWGFPGTMDEFCAKAKKEGYNGIEVWWPGDPRAQDDMFNALHKHGLEVGFLCGGSQSNAQEHLKSFTAMITAAAQNKVQRPLYINCHSGRDYFTAAENQSFIDLTDSLSRTTGITICHETHRGRMLYSAPVARSFLGNNPSMKVTLDISHWCNVHESLLADQPEAVNLALERTEHIHTRVGHAEGPQVSDPRAPEWEPALKAHLHWWDVVLARKRRNGEPMTLLTEFGPADYMWTLPYTRQPLADQWGINVHMMKFLRERYS